MSVYDKIYEVVRQVPAGKVASYGQIAKIVGECSPRQAGYALAALKEDTDVPWHRIINSRGEISVRPGSFRSGGVRLGSFHPGAGGHHLQRILLEAEGVAFDKGGKIDLGKHGWAGER